MMRIFHTFLFSLALLVLFGAQPIMAQSLGTAFLQDKAEVSQNPANIEEIIRQAKEGGIGVIVIDGAGNLVSQTPPDATVEASLPTEAQMSSLMQIQDQTVKFRQALLDRFLDLPVAFNEVLFILRAASPDGTLWAFVEVVLFSLALFGVGVLVEREVYGKRFMRRFIVAQIRDNPQGYSEKMPFLVLRFIAGVGGIIVSMMVAYVLGWAIFGQINDTAIQYTATLVNLGYFSCRCAAMLWRMILSPFLAQYRIPDFNDRDAKRLHRWLWGLANFDICFILFANWIRELGLNEDVYAFLFALMSLLIVLLNIMMVLMNRKPISNALRKSRSVEETPPLLRLLSAVWAPVVIVYVVFAWFELTYDLVLGNPGSVPLIMGAYVVFVSIIVVYGIINFVIERGFARARALRRVNEIMREEEAQEAALAAAEHSDASAETVERLTEELQETRADEDLARAALSQPSQIATFEALARRVAGILAFVVGVSAFFYIWDDSEGARMVEGYADRLLDVMAIILIGYIVYHAFRIWIDTKIREEVGEEVETELGDEGGGSSASRLATLLPLFRNIVLIAVVISIVLIVLMEFGVNVGPLFAGAGIIGIAVGFGSQALVRDIFAGAFFLFDDAFRKGEYLDVGGVKGTVEKISVRSFQLRHHLGALHTIPFGELQVMTNYSRDWVMMKLPLRVTYDTDVEKVRKLIKKLGQQLLEDPIIGPDFIQPLKSQGVIEMQDSAMIIRVKFMTKPGDQWVIRKKVYEEIRALFEREGIKFAHREVTVRLADGKVDELTEEQKKSVTAAAQATIDDELLEGGAEDSGGDDR